MTEDLIEKIVRDSFGLGLSAIFSSIESWSPGLSFDQRRDKFFFVIESLLNEGGIKFIAPGADCYVSPDNEKPKFSVADSAAQWDLEAGQIISYLKGKWPKNVASDNDEDLTFYFYEVPGVIWIDERGGYFSS
ncbi:hypothetical protein [Pseudomonas sp. CFBP 5750]